MTEKEKPQYKNYLKKTVNCQVNDSTIKKQIVSILSKVEGKITSKTKAIAFQSWIKDRHQYLGYSNTKYGAVDTLNTMKKHPKSKVVNCADQSHLMIALLRTSGIPAIYEHGQTSAGGHYWPRAYVDNDKWAKVDSTHYKNSYDETVWTVSEKNMNERIYSLNRLGKLDKNKKIDKKLNNQQAKLLKK